MRRWSIRARIAAASALVATALLGAVALVLAVQVQASAGASVEQLARDDLMPYVTDLRTQPDEGPDAVSPGTLVLVVDPTGVVRRDSMSPALAVAARRRGATGEVRADGLQYRVVTAEVRTGQGVWHLAAARDSRIGDLLADRVTATLLLAVPLIGLGTGIVAWLVATFTLRPVEAMRRSAERLRQTGSEEHLPAGPARDELHRLADTLNALLADLRADAVRERRLTADASHELRTPIAVLAAQIELLGDPPADEELAEIRRSVARLVVVADDLLELSRPPDAAMRRSPVRDLVTEAMDAVDRSRVLARGAVLVDLELDPALDESATCRIDRTAFGRVLTNLVGNALAATEEGGIVVRLRADGGDLVLEVADTGRGVPDEFLPQAFERFSRPVGDASGPGAGLGLSVVQRLVTGAGGTVSLRNRQGGGAVAVARFPAAGPLARPAPRDLEPSGVDPR